MYAISLSNGLEAYAKDRVEAEAMFQHCAAIGACALVFIDKCSRRTLARSIKKTNAALLGHYSQAINRAKAGKPIYEY